MLKLWSIRKIFYHRINRVAIFISTHDTKSDVLVFRVHHLDVLGVEDGNSELKLLLRLLRDVPDWLDLIWSDLCRVDLDPHLDYTLGNGGRWVVNLSVLDRLVLEGLPLSLEVSVLQVDLCGTNQVITEEIIVIHDVDLEWSATWEGRLEVVVSSEPRVWLIELVVGTLIEHILTTSDFNVWIRETTNIKCTTL